MIGIGAGCLNAAPDAKTPVVAIAAVTDSMTEGTQLQFAVRAHPAPAADLAVDISLNTPGCSPGPTTRIVTIAAGAARATFAVSTAVAAGGEVCTVTAAIAAGSGYRVDNRSTSATATLTRGDGGPGSAQTPVVTIAAAPGSVVKGNPAEFILTAAPPPAEPLTVNVASQEVGSSQTEPRLSKLTIPAGSATATLSADTENDLDAVFVSVLAGTGYGVGSPSYAAKILDNDFVPPRPVPRGATPPGGPRHLPEVTVAAATESVVEGNPLSFTLYASVAPEASLTVNVTWFGAAFLTGTRLTEVTIPAGSTTASFSVDTDDDGTDERDGVVTVTVRNGTGYTVGAPGSADVFVHDNDEEVEVEITIKAVNSLVEEFEGVSFKLIAWGTQDHALTVAVAWQETGSYLTGTLPSTVRIPAGRTTATLSADTDDDDTPEDAGTVTVTVIDGTGYSLGRSSDATLTVYDNDTLPTVSISSLPSTVRRGEVIRGTFKFDPPFSKLRASTDGIYYRVPGWLIGDYVRPGATYEEFFYRDTGNLGTLWFEVIDRPQYVLGEPSKKAVMVVDN